MELEAKLTEKYSHEASQLAKYMGGQFRAYGLKSETGQKLNSLSGTVVGFDEETGRLHWKLDKISSDQIELAGVNKLKPANLMIEGDWLQAEKIAAKSRRKAKRKHNRYWKDRVMSTPETLQLLREGVAFQKSIQDRYRNPAIAARIQFVEELLLAEEKEFQTVAHLGLEEWKKEGTEKEQIEQVLLLTNGEEMKRMKNDDLWDKLINHDRLLRCKDQRGHGSFDFEGFGPQGNCKTCCGDKYVKFNRFKKDLPLTTANLERVDVEKRFKVWFFSGMCQKCQFRCETTAIEDGMHMEYDLPEDEGRIVSQAQSH